MVSKKYVTMVFEYATPDEHENIHKAVADLNCVAVENFDAISKLEMFTSAVKAIDDGITHNLLTKDTKK